MTDLGPVAWPPTPLRTERLVLREPAADDRAALVELMASPEVHAFLGGARSREEVERALPTEPARRPGLFVVDFDGATIGIVTLDRRDPERPGRGGGAIELGYLLLPDVWGRGFAVEACAAALRWLDDVLPGEPVVLTTQTANSRSMRVATKLGFVELDRFEEFGAEQWSGIRRA
ncbi:GNAT family N-acetyltransferase [Luteimicrobium xylanilyticum]|uniref:GNAT family N-acetyltransferase n=1 Tax=Luteimicrobium xylanilyticum TaxID=1133546 RepID=UPI00055C82AA|nr:GNAT family N-acetyltransferase [Luteimicrobium xylanilyticum]